MGKFYVEPSNALLIIRDKNGVPYTIKSNIYTLNENVSYLVEVDGVGVESRLPSHSFGFNLARCLEDGDENNLASKLSFVREGKVKINGEQVLQVLNDAFTKGLLKSEGGRVLSCAWFISTDLQGKSPDSSSKWQVCPDFSVIKKALPDRDAIQREHFLGRETREAISKLVEQKLKEREKNV